MKPGPQRGVQVGERRVALHAVIVDPSLFVGGLLTACNAFHHVGDGVEPAFALRRDLGERLRAVGYVFVALDVFGYRSGALNELLGNRP